MNHPVPVKAPAAPVLNHQDVQQYLTFMVAGEMFGFGIRHIKEIIEFGHVTQVPMMPRFVRGVINLRGNVVPVIDLSARFNRELSTINKRTCIVIVELQNDEGLQDVGVVVDSVCEVLEIGDSQIEPPPSFGVRVRTDFIHGMGKIGDRFVVLLNRESVLSLDDLALVSELQQLDVSA